MFPAAVCVNLTKSIFAISLFGRKEMALKKSTKTIFFLFAAIVIGLGLLELIAQIAEIVHPPKPAEVRSPLEYQTILDSEPVEAWNSEKGKSRRLVATWAERPCEWVYEEKQPNEIRIVFLGGSAVLGVGYALPATFTSVAQRLLTKAYPQKKFRVINLAHIGYASPQLAYINEHLLPYLNPDLVITVLGNNEFRDVSAFTHKLTGQSSSVKQWIAARWLERHLALARWARPKMKIKELSREEKNSFPELKYRKDVWNFVYSRLRRTIKKIGKDTNNQGAKLMVCSVPVNRRFGAPREWFYAENPDGSYPELFRWANWALTFDVPDKAAEFMNRRLSKKPDDLAARLILARAQKAMGRHGDAADNFRIVKKKTALLLEDEPLFERQVLHCEAICRSEEKRKCEEATRDWIDRKQLNKDQYNDFWQAGTLASIAGDAQKAGEYFSNSLNYNPGRTRASDELNDVLLTTAQKINGARPFDLAKEFGQYARQHIPGFDLFVDYCHYNVKGHIIAGHVLAREISAAFDLPDKVPPVSHGLKRYAMQRNGRLSDLPDFEDWAGVDFDVPRLVEQNVLPALNMESLLQKQIEKNGPSVLSETFKGNWALAYHGCWDQSKAKKHYEDALKIDPEFAPAKGNLKILETLNLRY